MQKMLNKYKKTAHTLTKVCDCVHWYQCQEDEEKTQFCPDEVVLTMSNLNEHLPKIVKIYQIPNHQARTNHCQQKIRYHQRSNEYEHEMQKNLKNTTLYLYLLLKSKSTII